MNIQEIRQKYPQYKDLTDEQIAIGLHQKAYRDMSFPEFAKRIGYSPMNQEARDMSAGSVFATGMGRTVDRLAGGLKQAVVGTGAVMAEGIPDALGGQKVRDYLASELVDLDKTMRERDALYQPLKQERPYISTGGEVVPMMAAPMLRVASGAGAAPAIANAAITGAAPSLVEYGTAQEKAKNALMGAGGGAVGGALGVGVSRVLNPVRPQVTQTQQAAVNAAERLGLNLSPGELTGSKTLKWMESALGDLPISGGMEQARQLANTKALNTKFAESLGQAADEITPQVLSAARQETGALFQQLFSNRGVPLDKTFQAEVKNIVGSKVMKELRDESVEPLLNQFRSLPNGNITLKGDWFQQNKTALDAAIRTAYNTGQNGKAKALEGLEKALDGALRRSMNGDEKMVFDAANKQWATLRIAETGQVIKDGRVMPAALDQAMKTRYGSAYREGALPGNLADISSVASTLRPPPNSGTAARGIYSGLAGGMAFAEPMTAAAMLTGPALASKAMQSEAGKRYLTKGILPISTAAEEALIRVPGGLLGGVLPIYQN